MRKKKLIVAGIILALSLVMIIAGCGGKSTPPSNEQNQVAPNGGQENVGDTSSRVGEQVNYEIIGIDPGAGIMEATREVLKQYGLDQWKLIESSESAMMAALKRAYDKQEPIIITGWTPHWKFASFDLRYLDDPLEVYGGAEQIHTLARKGLKEDHPSAYQILDNFMWEPSDMEEVMIMIEDGSPVEDAAASWVANNMDRVRQWTDGADQVNGDKISLAYVAWASEIASTNVVATVLETVGYRVTLQQLEAGGMFAGISGGSTDALVAAWLPTTHAAFYERFQNDFEDLGPNLDGTRIGLVVPAYMNITSIEDLK